MATTLCFDFGNTRMKCAVFTNGEFVREHVLENDRLETIQALIDQYHPSKSILSSVIDHSPEMENLLAATTRFHKLGHLSRLPVTTPVGKPETIGADRLALVVAAAHLFPGNKYKEFIGGGISPGMEMRFKSLQVFTAKLPLVKADWNFPLAGYDTRTNILSGVILGMAKEIDGIVAAYEEKYANFNVLLSGGDAVYFTRHLKKQYFTDPYLIYKGLYVISEYNNE
jgi:type III pantothenate kinase